LHRVEGPGLLREYEDLALLEWRHLSGGTGSSWRAGSARGGSERGGRTLTLSVSIAVACGLGEAELAQESAQTEKLAGVLRPKLSGRIGIVYSARALMS
jgi:hypothetical protein